jgi:NAD(P)H dehydrogenase (quinone)
MKLIITGASGPFGSSTAEGLLHRGIPAQDLILVTRTPKKLAHYAALGAQVRRGDFDDPASLAMAFVGGEKMLFISTNRVGQRMPQHTNAVNAAVAAGVKHIVYTSFVGANPDNASVAVADHRGTESLLRASGVHWTALRNSQYSDAIVEAIAPLVLRTGRWQASAADGRLAHVTRQDCIDCAVAVMATPGHLGSVYNVTGPELLSLRDCSKILSDVAGAPIQYVVVSDADMYAYFDGLGIPRVAIDDNVVDGVPWCSDDMVSFEKTIREGYFAILSNDVEKLTGHKPQPLRDFAMQRRQTLKALGHAMQ